MASVVVDLDRMGGIDQPGDLGMRVAAFGSDREEGLPQTGVEGRGCQASGGDFVDKNDRCDGYNNDRYLDDDCFGTRGYPADPRY